LRAATLAGVTEGTHANNSRALREHHTLQRYGETDDKTEEVI
jgi:hypothetical protein